MKIDVIPFCTKLNNNHLLSSTVIVVDVLRASTNMVLAIQNGADKVIPANDPGEAARLSIRLSTGNSVLAGESGGLKLPDFDLGNSPFEYKKENVTGKTVIMATSNGTRTVCAAAGAPSIFIGSMINRSAVADKAVQAGRDVLILCAGTENAISADDLCCAGGVISAMAQAGAQIQLTDIALLCKTYYQDWKEGRADIRETAHPKRLIQLGFEEDIEYCFREDVTDVVPRYENGIIV